MPSRRELLGIAGSVAVGCTLAGCLSDLDLVSAELVQLQAVTVEWRHEGRTYSDQLLQLHFDGAREITGRVAAEYTQLVSSPGEITVSEAVRDELEREFRDVRYGIGLCGEDLGSDDEYGCRNAPTSREDFNTIQFGDQAEATIADNRITLQEINDNDIDDWTVDISEFDWDDLHAGHGQ
ncbi:hypothetical protein [Natronorubrum sp. DTA7]|uniref:hypothetical protein n=1 Tax=Natronorubrum sp. DTA7 TaxID=3447016 RepID=UPI003F84E5E8